MSTAISRGVATQLIALAAADPYREVCGLLLGAPLIDGIAPLANVAADPARSFEIDPAGLIAAHRAARHGGPPIAGYFHSHPHGPASPSRTDQELAAPDGRIWAIVAGQTIGWWRAAAHGFVRLDVAIVDPPDRP